MAMHFYNTGTSFQRVDDPFLLRAIQIARPGAKLPTRKQLADDSRGGLLEECYGKVKWISSCQVKATMSALHLMHGRMYPLNQSSIIWQCGLS